MLAEKNAGGKGNYGFYVVGKLINYANWTHDNTGGPVIDLYEGAEVVQNDGVLYSGDIFRSKDSDGYVGTVTRTITINGGTMTATGNDTYHYPIVWFSKPGTCNLAINGGTFETAVYGSIGSVDEPTITGLDGSCQAKFKDTFLKVRDTETASGLSAYVAPGYELVQGVDDYYTIQAIPTYTVDGITVANASVVATNKTAGGAKFALPAVLLRDTQIAVTVTPDTDYEYATPPAGWAKNEDGSITTNATVTADLAITVEAPAKKAADPVDPETPKHYDTTKEAEDAAKAINDNKATMIKTPEGAVAEDYTALFTAVVKDTDVVVELNQSGTNALEEAAATIETAVAGELGEIAAAAAGGDVEVVVTGVEPGFWYGVAATADLTTMGASQPGEWKQATTEGVTLTVTKPTTGNAAFFQTRAAVKNPAVGY